MVTLAWTILAFIAGTVVGAIADDTRRRRLRAQRDHAQQEADAAKWETAGLRRQLDRERAEARWRASWQ